VRNSEAKEFTSYNPILAMDSKALYCLTSSLAAKLLSVNTKGYGCEKVCFWIFLHWNIQ